MLSHPFWRDNVVDLFVVLASDLLWANDTFPERGHTDMSVPGGPVLKVWPQELHTILNIAAVVVPESTV